MKKLLTTAVVCLLAGSAFGQSADFLDWEELSPLPPNPGDTEQLGMAGPFVGVHEGHLIVAGGANFPKPVWDTTKVWYAHAWAYNLETKAWLPQTATLEGGPVAYGTSVSTKKGVVCLGGNDGKTVSAKAFVMTLKDGKMVQTPLPDLPSPLTYSSAAAVGDVVYVAGGTTGMGLETAANVFWKLDLSADAPAWESMEWPTEIPARAFNMTVAQKNGPYDCIYIIGGRRIRPGTVETDPPEKKIEFLSDVWEYNLKTKVWRQRSDLPSPRVAGVAAPLGGSHIFVIGGDAGENFFKADELKDDHPGFVKTTLAYHTITDTWIEGGKQPANHVTTSPVVVKPDKNDPKTWQIIMASGEIRPRVRSPKIWSITATRSKTDFGMVNWVTLVVYLSAMIGVGVFFSFRNKSTDDFFRGGQRIPWWVAGLSIFATMLSSITFVALPAKSFMTDWGDFVYNMGIVVVAPLVVFCILPFFRRIDATTAYEYLEKRFNVLARSFGSLCFVFFQIGRMAIVMYLPALALNAVLPGIDVVTIICAMGVLSIIYCSMGGLEAVVWTDAIQAIVLLGGGFISFLLIIKGVDGGFSGFLEMAKDADKLTVIKDTNLFAFSKYSHEVLWVILVGAIANNLIPYASDQAVVQRYVSTSTEKKAAKAIWLNAITTIPASLLFFGLGTALFCYYKSNPVLLDPGFKNDQIFPLFIARQLPIGVAGVVVAGIFAAAQSTISTSMNSTSTALVSDFARRFKLVTDDKKNLMLARVLTVILGALGTGMAIYFYRSGSTSMWDSFISLIGLIGGPMAGLFLLGIFTKRASGASAVVAGTVAISLAVFVKFETDIHGKLYGAIGIVVTMVLGYVLGFVFKGDDKHTEGLTIYSLKKSQDGA